MYRIGQVLWALRLVVKRFWCWCVGHEVRTGDGLAYCDYCDRCCVTRPQDLTTLSDLLRESYGWLVERNWEWFERLDDWLCENHSQKLPGWWEY